MNTKLQNKWVEIEGNPYYQLSSDHGDMFLDVLCGSPTWYDIVPDFCRAHVLSYAVRLGRKTEEIADDYRKINVYMYTLLRKVMDTALVLSPSGEWVDETATLAKCKAIAEKHGTKQHGSGPLLPMGSPCDLTNIKDEHTAAFISTLLNSDNVFVWLAAYLVWLDRLHIRYNKDLHLVRDRLLKWTEIVELPFILISGMSSSINSHDLLNMSPFWYHKKWSAGPNTTFTPIQDMKMGKLMRSSFMSPEHEVDSLENFTIVEDVYAEHGRDSSRLVCHSVADGYTGKLYLVEMWLRHAECHDNTYQLLDFIDKVDRVIDSPLFFYKMKYDATQ